MSHNTAPPVPVMTADIRNAVPISFAHSQYDKRCSCPIAAGVTHSQSPMTAETAGGDGTTLRVIHGSCLFVPRLRQNIRQA
jgi:hypothetical protein